MPIGCQIIAGKGSDAAVLGFAAVLEKALEKLGDAGGGVRAGPGPGGRLVRK
jgi:Asp-tRNA(Asn)/Glu-tRNA(Gln) amidotransferase A subunit family amidase